MNDKERTELEIASQRAIEARPSWAMDGTSERPAGPPQMPLPMPRGAKLNLDVSASMVVGNEGNGTDTPTVTVALARRRSEGVFEAEVWEISGTPTDEEI